MKRFMVLFCVLLVMAGCEKKSSPPTTSAKEKVVPIEQVALPEAHVLLQAPMEPTLVETPAEALPLWRKYATAKPLLLLMANDPFLAPLPESLETEVITLVQNGTEKDLLTRTDPSRADTFLFPAMAVETALRADLFSGFYWILPTKATPDELSVDVLSKQLLDLGAIDTVEAATLVKTDAGIEGVVRGIPFRAILPGALPPLTTPAVLHIDLSYFQPIYKGEIKTPIYSVLQDTMTTLRKTGWKIHETTISLGNMGGSLPLQTRFLGKDIATVFTNPSILEASPPINWNRRGNALYLENFFQPEEIRKLYLQMEADAPEDASVKFGLYQSARSRKEGASALEYLSQAVALDRIYALEYLNLAQVAMEKNLPQKKLDMLRLALRAFPDDSILKLQTAQAVLESGDREEGLKLVEELEKVAWSPVYYNGIPALLDELKAHSSDSGPKE